MSVNQDIFFPSVGVRVLSAFLHFAGVSVLAHCLSRRVAVERLTSVVGILQLSPARLLILLVFLDSWLFMFTSGMVVFGAGLEASAAVCSMAMYLCILFYASSKALIYFFLVEKMHIVWAPITGSRRMKSPVYIFAFAVAFGYLVIIVLLFVGHIARFRADGACVIGLRHLASIPLISYDFFTNVLLTTLFLFPLWQSPNLSPRVRRIATRTTLAALVALATSTTNMLILTLMHGEQLGWVCLGSCGADVVGNALALFWVTAGPPDETAHSRSDGRTPGKPTALVFRPTPPQPLPSPNDSGRPSAGSVFERTKGSEVATPPVTPISPSTPMATLRTMPSQEPRPGGLQRLKRMFSASGEEQQQHELQITVTHECDVQADEV